MANSQSPQRPQRIVWPVDPFLEDFELQKRIVEVLRAISRKERTQIEPISIVQWDDRFLVPGNPSVMEEVRTHAEARVRDFIKKAKLEGVLPPIVCSQADLSLQRAVQTVIDRAKKTDAQLIAVSSRARKGATRFLLGSFAETLVLLSPIPVLMVSSRMRPLKKLKQILFPTDFKERSRATFPLVVESAAELGLKVAIFHRLEVPPEKTMKVKGYREIVKREIDRVHSLAEPMIQMARAKGTECKLLVHAAGAGPVEYILKEAGKTPGTIVAMVSHTGPTLGPILLGSITRQVMQHATCPVWIIHPK